VNRLVGALDSLRPMEGVYDQAWLSFSNWDTKARTTTSFRLAMSSCTLI
jgi:hypothetical protein